MTLAYLSEKWFDAATAAVAASDRFADLDDVVVNQIVVDQAGESDDRELAYHLSVDGGRGKLVRGRHDEADLTITLPHAAAEAIAAGTVTAQDVFIRGQVRIGGDPQRMISAQPAFIALADALAAVRARTSFG